MKGVTAKGNGDNGFIYIRAWAEKRKPHSKASEQILRDVADFQAGKLKKEFRPEVLIEEE